MTATALSSPLPQATQPVRIEVCTENVDGVRICAREGAHRAELCDNLAAGGTTPSIGAVEAAIFAAAEEVDERRARMGAHWASKPGSEPFGLRIMIRPRGGSYVFTKDESRTMVADVRRIAALAHEMSEFTTPQRVAGGGKSLPAAVEVGFVLGALTREHAIDRGLLRLLVATASGLPVTFSRAFDETRDLVEAYGDLGGLDVDSVLTSGGARSALDGAPVLRALAQASDGPRLIAAGEVCSQSLGAVAEASGLREIHLRCSTPADQHGLYRTDADLVREALAAASAI